MLNLIRDVYLTNSLNTRELAMLMWMLLVLIWLFVNSRTRSAVFSLFRAFISGKILSSILIISIYSGLEILILKRLGYWELSLAKDSVIWFLGTAFVMLVNYEKATSDSNSIRKLIINNIKLSFVLEFLVNFYTFPFVIELIMIPFLVLIVGMATVSEKMKDAEIVKKFMGLILGIFGICILLYTTLNLLKYPEQFFTYWTIKDLLLFPILTTAFLPCIYFFSLYATYELLFLRIDWQLKDNKNFRFFAKAKILQKCHISLYKVRRFSQNVGITLSNAHTKEEVLSLIDQALPSIIGNMSWKIVTKGNTPMDSKVKALMDEAIAAAPKGYLVTDNQDQTEMLPKKPLVDRCRLCGKTKELTKEHIPPKASGNKARLTTLSFDDWLKDHLETDATSKHLIQQGGLFGYTLCKDCNSFTGNKYGNEYISWVTKANKVIQDLGTGIVPSLDQSIGPFIKSITFGNTTEGSVKPGALVRQVLSCMCSLSGKWDLAAKHPEIRRIVLEQTAETLPTGMELGMSLYFGPKIRIHGPQLRVDYKTGIWRWCQEIAFPPFAFQLIIASNSTEPGLGLLINDFTTIKPDQEMYFTGDIEMGFGWSPYPGDYRSSATIKSERQPKS